MARAIRNLTVTICALFGLPLALLAQSTDSSHPTPITSNEISGTIRARDIGDSRLTSYFYAFEGSQGDIFINVVTKNFSGDIDVFNAEGLRPLTKMVIYADSSVSETGRLIYLRKSERLVLRIEGRSPNDDPADFRIKFGGSFIALAPQKVEDAPSVAKSEQSETGVRVNSVGTILPPLPKPDPPKLAPEEKLAREAPEERVEEKKAEVRAADLPAAVPEKKEDADVETLFENKTAKVTVAPPVRTTAKRPPRTPPVKTAKASKSAIEDSSVPTEKTSKTKAVAEKSDVEPPPIVEPKVDPLANIRLIVQLKDGETIDRPMSEVVRFGVDKGVLTVLLKGGKVTRYSILDVAKVTIE